MALSETMWDIGHPPEKSTSAAAAAGIVFGGIELIVTVA